MDVQKVLSLIKTPGEWWIFSNAATDEQMESFVLKLSDILADESRNDDQEVAVNYMKRQITSKNDIIRDHHHRRWLAFTSKTRDQIKQNIIAGICNDTTLSTPIAECMIIVSAIEFLQNQHILKNVVENVVSLSCFGAFVFDAINYICQKIDAKYVLAEATDLLTIISAGIEKEEIDVIYSAIKLFYTLLNIFEVEPTQQIPKQLDSVAKLNGFLVAINNENTQISCIAINCVTKLSTLISERLNERILEDVSMKLEEAFNSKDEQIIVACIAFWSSVAHNELYRKMPSHSAAQNFQSLWPILVEIRAHRDHFSEKVPAEEVEMCLKAVSRWFPDGFSVALDFAISKQTETNWLMRDAVIDSLRLFFELEIIGNRMNIPDYLISTLISYRLDENYIVRKRAAILLNNSKLVFGDVFYNLKKSFEPLVKKLSVPEEKGIMFEDYKSLLNTDDMKKVLEKLRENERKFEEKDFKGLILVILSQVGLKNPTTTKNPMQNLENFSKRPKY